MWLHRLKCWNTIDSRVRICCSWCASFTTRSPWRLRTSATSLPATRMRPAVGHSRKLMQRSQVLLPEPDEPMMLITSPEFAVSETPLSTSWSP
jgi:hypothetical protein